MPDPSSNPPPLLRLLRAGTLFSPGADVVAGLCLAELDWSVAAARAVLASILLYAAGMVLNDHADREEDALSRPERPIPRGEVRAGTALALGLSLITGALLLSPVPWHHGVMAALVLGYDYLWKKLAVVGALTMGTLRGMNLATGFVMAPAITAERALGIACGAYGLYIFAVTLLGIMEDRPPAPRVIRSLQAVPPVVTFLALLSLGGSLWPAAALFLPWILLFAWRNRRIAAWDQQAIRGSMTWLLLGTMLYTSLLCLTPVPARWIEALLIAAAILPARWISRRIALT